MAIPANVFLAATFQDDRGFKATTRIPLFFTDLSVSTGVGGLLVSSLYQLTAGTSGSVMAKLALMSNAKLVKVSMNIDFDYAQEPSTETGTYQLVIQKAKMRFADGTGGFSNIDLPAPVDSLFLASGQDNLIVVDPTSPLIGNFQNAFAAEFAQAAVASGNVSLPGTARDGLYAVQFDGGQLVQGKPRRRRVVQGA